MKNGCMRIVGKFLCFLAVGALVIAACSDPNGSEPLADKDALIAKIAEAESAKTGVEVSPAGDGSEWQPTTNWVTQTQMNDLNSAISAAQTVRDDENATQAAVDAQVTALDTALGNFDPKPGRSQANKTLLITAINEAEDLKIWVKISEDGSDIVNDREWVTQTQMNTLNSVISAAQAVRDNADATQTTVDNQVSALNTALGTFNSQLQNGEIIIVRIPTGSLVTDPAGELMETPVSPSGEPFVSVTHNGTIVFVIHDIALDLLDLENDGALHMEIYVDDASLIQGGQFEITSSGGSDSQEYHFDIGGAIQLQNGWNTVNVSFEYFNQTGGKPNLAEINYVRLFFLVSGGTATVGITNAYFYHGDPFEHDEGIVWIPGKGVLWDTPGGTIPETLPPPPPSDGTYQVVGAFDTVIFNKTSISLDLSEHKDDGVLYMELYVDYPDRITGGQFEFYSTSPDVNEMSFDFGSASTADSISSTLVPNPESWHILELPFSQLNEVGGPIDWESVVGVRFYLGAGHVTVGLGEVYVYHAD